MSGKQSAVCTGGFTYTSCSYYLSCSTTSNLANYWVVFGGCVVTCDELHTTQQLKSVEEANQDLCRLSKHKSSSEEMSGLCPQDVPTMSLEES